MKKSAIFKTCLLASLISLLLAAVPLTAAYAAPAWSKVADKGVTNPNNTLMTPSETYGNNLTFGGFSLPTWPAPGTVSAYTYGSSGFAQIGTNGLGDPNATSLAATATFKDQLYIGRYDANVGGALYRWSGSGDPVLVPGTENGFGKGAAYTMVIPLGVIDNQLVVCLENEVGGLSGALEMFKYDGTTWTQIVGGSSGVQAGFGSANNPACVALTGERPLFHGMLIMTVENMTDGLSVWGYDGTTFHALGKAGDTGLWTSDQGIGITSTSGVEDKLYLGTLTTPGVVLGTLAGTPGVGGTLWSYNGSSWTEILNNGMALPGRNALVADSTDDIGIFPLARGGDLYVSTWNLVTGCRVYKRSGTTFQPISDANFGEALAPGDFNFASCMKSFNGNLYVATGNGNGSEIWSTPILPTIDHLEPSSGPYGITLKIVGNDFGPTRGTGKVMFAGHEITDVVSWSDDAINLIVPPQVTTGAIKVVNGIGESNEVTYTITLSDTYYFAEGTTRDNAIDGSYEEWLSIQNPNDKAANVTMTYMLGDGTTQVQKVVVGPRTRGTYNVNEFVGKDKDVSVVVHSEDQLILAERPMYFNYRNKWTGGHDVMGLTAPRKQFYFAEGTTRDNSIDGSYEEWLCLQNPLSASTDVKVTFMLETGQNIEKTYQLGATTRRTIDVTQEVGKNHDVSMVVEGAAPIVAERPMYFSYRNKWVGGHNVMGASGPDTDFYFAEGTTRSNTTDGYYETWICLQNPQNTGANVTITYYVTGAGQQTQNVVVGPKSRSTVDVKLKLGANVDTSFIVHSSEPILAERPTYFKFRNAWTGGHNVMGCASPKNNFYFAEGTTVTNFSTFVAVMNTSDTDQKVTFSYMLGDGTNKQAEATVGPHQRYTRDAWTDVGSNQNVSIVVTGDKGIVCERPMYFLYHGWCPDGSNSLGYGI